MDLASLVRLTILASMMMLVLALGLRSSAGAATYLVRRPVLLVRSLLSMNVVMPLLVLWLVTTFELRPAVRIALVALAISPVPPFLPRKELKLTTSEGYTYGLFITTALCAVVLVPATIALLEARTVRGLHISATRVLSIVAMTVLIPLLLGILVRRLAPTLAARLQRIFNVAGALLLVAAMIPVLISQWPAVRSLVGDGTVLAIVAFTALGLGVGHVLGGPDPDDRSVLALATASRHPAVAIAIASVNFPEQKLVPAAILLTLLVSTIAAAPYTAWRKRAHAARNVSGPTNTPMAGRS